ncbi:MAG TPA: glycoside hydrolase family 3 N-terminal domain-containing protein [Blastocatellia bacterium]|nr:glycoside hydrolase family 3 N-terminal domain-containing protein [Blastocatellia bacterium]
MQSVFIKLKVFALLFAFTLLFTPVASTQTGGNLRFDRKLSKKEEDWVRKTLHSLTLDEKIGQMIVAEANVVFWNREGAEYKKLRRHIVDNKVGGVILFRSQVWPAAVVTNRWQEMAKIPLLISADLEMGPGMRLDDTPWWAPNMAVAATGDPNWARLQGEATALQARAVGVNWLLAPVADVNNNPDNPVINTRSYGEDPAAVAGFVRAFIEGAQSAGAMACAKHFPGHGDTATDSHIGLPMVDVGRGRLERLELVPFRAAIAAGVGSIMSAHIALPQIETEFAAPVRSLSEREAAAAEFLSRTEAGAGRMTLPSTLSPKIMTGLLREGLKFDGLITTDALSMAGVAARYTPAQAAVRSLKAGVDVITKSPDIDAAIAGIKEAVARGEITEARINASVERILRAKAALGLSVKRAVDLREVDRVMSNPRFNEIAQQIADRSITLVRDERRLLPLDPKARLLNLTFTDEDDPEITKVFVDELRSRAAQAEIILLDHHATESDISHLLARLNEGRYDAVIFSVAVRARSGKGTVALPPIGKRLSDALIGRKLPLIVISFGNPYLLAAMPNAPSYLLAYSPFAVSQRAATKAVFGEIEISGKLPAAIPGLYPRGYGLSIRRREP